MLKIKPKKIKKTGFNFKLLGIGLIVVLTLSTGFLNVHSAIGQTNQLTTKLQAANSAIEQAFTAVLDAEKNGADVTGLLTQLNQASQLLAKSENENRIGEFNQAAIDADKAALVSQQVSETVYTLDGNVLVSAQTSFWSTDILTVIFSVEFIALILLVWPWFKGRYIAALSDRKPEVETNEA